MIRRSYDDSGRVPPVVADLSICGCAGKTPLERVIRPARELMAERLSLTNVELGPDADVALMPLTDCLDRKSVAMAIDDQEPTSDRQSDERGESGGDSDDSASTSDSTARTWALSVTVANAILGRESGTFAAGVGEAYRNLGRRTCGPLTVAKGHAIQLSKADASHQWTELLRPVGPRHPGYRAGNVDVIHALPEKDYRAQARIATVHAMNDCYAVGATGDRTVQPVVGVPRGTPLAAETVNDWYADAAPENVEVLSADVLEHDGMGWLFGASATATTNRNPPVPTDTGDWTHSELAGTYDPGDEAIQPGDEVLLHRPLGGLAATTLAAVDESREDDVQTAATEALTEDHQEVGKIIASFRPAVGKSVVPSHHILVTTDVSGPGITGIGKRLSTADRSLGLRIERIPVLSTAVDEAADRWILPDATIETNGPVAVVARPSVVDMVASELAACSECSPVRIGQVAITGERAIESAPGVELDRYIETAPSEGDPS